MLPYYSLAEKAHELSLGARALGEGPLIELDLPAYHGELAQKEQLLAADHGYYFQAHPHSEPAQWEALAAVLRDLASRHPDTFTLTIDGDCWTWRNGLLDGTTVFRYGDAGSLPNAPLDWAGRQVQEDLLLLDGRSEGFPLMAGQLCFPNRWSLDEKMGLSFAAIHGPVPDFDARLGKPATLLLERMKAGRPVWRYNWLLVPSAELDLSTRAYARAAQRLERVDVGNCGQRLFLRSERQTLSRLEQSGAILFTIHTYRTPLDALAADPAWSRRFLEVIDRASPALLRYKGVGEIVPVLRDYLKERATPLP